LKSIFSEFGNIHDLHHKDGIWTVLFTSLNPTLPLMYHLHLDNGSKNRWFDVEGSLVSFASRTPCSKCKIKGHSSSSCPGDPLIKLLNKEIKPIQPKINKSPSIKPTQKKKNQKKKEIDLDNSLLVAVSEESSSEEYDIKISYLDNASNNKIKNNRDPPPSIQKQDKKNK